MTMSENVSSEKVLGAANPAEPNKPLIFIVDDEPLNRFLIAEALAVDNYDIVEADCGEAALDYVINRTVDLILLDIDMPGMGGLAACKAIRALPHGKLVPIAIVTGLDESVSIEHAFDCGATDFLTKPVNWTLMRQRVRFMLRLGSITQALQRNEQILENVHEIAQIGHWEWDVVNGIVTHSELLRRLDPRAPAHISGVTLCERPSTEGAQTVLTMITESIKQQQATFQQDFSVDIPGRGRRHLLHHGHIEYRDGKPVYVICTVQDITERQQNEERYATIFNASPVGLIETDYSNLYAVTQQAGFSSWSDAQLRDAAGELVRERHKISYYSKANLAAQELFVHNDVNSHTLGTEITFHFLAAARDGQREISLPCQFPRLSGETISVVVGTRIPTTPEEYKRIVLSFVDVTDLMQRKAQLKRADAIIANSSDAVAVFDRHRRVQAINPAYTKVTGYTFEQIQSMDMLNHLKVIDRERTLDTVRKTLATQDHWRGEIEFVRQDGSIMPAIAQLNVIRNEHGEFDGCVAITTDISHIKESEQRLYQLAHFDELTGLPNRLSLQERLQNELDNRPVLNDKTDTHEFALLYIDLDGFKLVNDSMGHPTGDKLLREVSARLHRCCLAGDLLTRIGGDEFALLMFSGITTAEIETQAERILTALKTPFVVDGREIFIGASIGACRYPQDAATSNEMLRNADSAMYEAKRLGRGQLCYYSAELTDESNRRLQVENELRVAIASNQLFLVYQPQYDATSGAMIGAEALVRWRNPRRGVVPPNEFIGIAETSGLIIPLGEWVINEACRQIAEWQREADCAVPVAINISALHLRQHNLPQVLGDAFRRFNVDPTLFEIEITEDSLDFRNEENAPYDILHKLSALGISIAIDDFGTGYSSLSRLKEMPISTLKIDRSFVRDIASSESDHAIITAIVGLAKTLDMSIVAEGVETEAQAAQLRALKCNILQGFLFSRPVAPTELLETFLAQHKNI